MYHKHHTKGIVLVSKSEGVSDRRVAILTSELGLVWARAQSARQDLSKLRAGCQEFALGEFSLVQGKTGWRLVGVRTEKNFFEICKNEPAKLEIMANIFRLLRRLISGEEANPKLFQTISDFLEFLVGAENAESQALELLVVMRIMHLLGFLREDPEFLEHLSFSKIENQDLQFIALRRARIVRLINESLSVADANT